MLVLNPNKRIIANEVLKHPFFTNKPLPSDKKRITEIVRIYFIITINNLNKLYLYKISRDVI